MKLKAFTLMEILVGMVLTTIISVMAFSSYILIQKQFSVLQKTQNVAQKYQRARITIKKDFKKALFVEKSAHQLVFTNENGIVYYNLSDKGLTRYHSTIPDIKDTLIYKWKEVQCFLLETPAQEGLIDKLVIHVDVFEEVQRLSITKKYSAEALINYTVHEY